MTEANLVCRPEEPIQSGRRPSSLNPPPFDVLSEPQQLSRRSSSRSPPPRMRSRSSTAQADGLSPPGGPGHSEPRPVDEKALTRRRRCSCPPPLTAGSCRQRRRCWRREMSPGWRRRPWRRCRGPPRGTGRARRRRRKRGHSHRRRPPPLPGRGRPRLLPCVAATPASPPPNGDEGAPREKARRVDSEQVDSDEEGAATHDGTCSACR